MSFRARLTSFFILIVIVPMAAVGFLVFRLIGQAQTGKADARAAGIAAAAASAYRSDSSSASIDARTLARDIELTPVSALKAACAGRARRRPRACHRADRLSAPRRHRRPDGGRAWDCGGAGLALAAALDGGHVGGERRSATPASCRGGHPGRGAVRRDDAGVHAPGRCRPQVSSAARPNHDRI